MSAVQHIFVDQAGFQSRTKPIKKKQGRQIIACKSACAYEPVGNHGNSKWHDTFIFSFRSSWLPSTPITRNSESEIKFQFVKLRKCKPI